jgi:hypothetical protein
MVPHYRGIVASRPLWLDTDPWGPCELLVPPSAMHLVALPVGSGVNSVRLDGRAHVAPAGLPLA